MNWISFFWGFVAGFITYWFCVFIKIVIEVIGFDTMAEMKMRWKYRKEKEE